MSARLYHRATPADRPEVTEEALAELRAAAAGRGLPVAGEYLDSSTRGAHPWPQRRRLVDDLERGDVVLVHRLDLLGRQLEDLVHLLHAWAAAGIHLVALQDTLGALPLDTTQPGPRLRVTDAVKLLRTYLSGAAAEARRLSEHRGTAAAGRRRLAINPQEVADLYHAGRSQAEAARTLLGRHNLQVSRTTYRQVLQDLRAAGRLDDSRRHQAIARRGGLPKGGRPRKRPER